MQCLQVLIYAPVFVVVIFSYEATEIGIAVVVGFAVGGLYMVGQCYLGKYIGILRYDFMATYIYWFQYYNKEYREGFPRVFLLTAAKVSDNPRGISQRYFFILSTDGNPLRCLICQNMSKQSRLITDK